MEHRRQWPLNFNKMQSVVYLSLCALSEIIRLVFRSVLLSFNSNFKKREFYKGKRTSVSGIFIVYLYYSKDVSCAVRYE